MLEKLFINATILVTFITLGTMINSDPIDNTVTYSNKIKRGLCLGILGSILIHYGVSVNKVIVIDFRYIPIIIATLTGGYISALITGLIIAISRMIFDGAINIVSIFSGITVFIYSISCCLIAKQVKTMKMNWIYMSIFYFLIEIGFLVHFVKEIPYLIYLITIMIFFMATLTTVTYHYVNYTFLIDKLHEKYKKELTEDYVTGLHNEKQFVKYLNKLISRVSEKQKVVSLLIISIDDFKNINDTYGHSEGDLLLKKISNIITTACRSFDIISRISGDKFAIILDNCEEEQAKKIGERIRSTIEYNTFILSDKTEFYLTVSVGLSSYPNTTKDANYLLSDAVDALNNTNTKDYSPISLINLASN